MMNSPEIQKNHRFVKAWSKEINSLLPKYLFEFGLYMFLRNKAYLYDQRFRYHEKMVGVKAGQTLISYRELAEIFNCSESNIRRCLRFLEGMGLVRLESDHHHTVVTLVNHAACLSDLERLMHQYGMMEVEAQQVLALVDSYHIPEEEAVRTVINTESLQVTETPTSENPSDAPNDSDNHCVTKNVDAVNIFDGGTIEDQCDALNTSDNQSFTEICDAPRDDFDAPNSYENEQVTEMCDAHSIEFKCNLAIREKKDINSCIRNNSLRTGINKKESFKRRLIHITEKDIQEMREKGTLLAFLRAVKGNGKTMSTEDFLELHEFVHRDEMNAVGATAIPIVSPVVWNKLGPVVL